MAVETKAPTHAAPTSETLRIDFLFLDLTTCTRCLGADRSLASALEVVREVLEATGVEVEVGKILVESAEHARALRLVSSPTIRVAGQDVALELRRAHADRRRAPTAAATRSPAASGFTGAGSTPNRRSR